MRRLLGSARILLSKVPTPGRALTARLSRTPSLDKWASRLVALAGPKRALSGCYLRNVPDHRESHYKQVENSPLAEKSPKWVGKN